MKTIRKIINKYPFLSLLVLTTISVLLVFGPYLFQLRPFTINNDQVFEYTALYKEWKRLLEGTFTHKGLPMYSWNTFLGNDFYSSMAFYVTGDIFLPLLFVFPTVSSFLFAETVLCVYISASAMYLFLKEIQIQKPAVRVYLSLLFAFSGWSVLFYGQYMFHRFFAFIPFLFYGAEHFFRGKSKVPFILSVGLLFYHSFYYMWPLSLFLLFYCLVRETDRRRTVLQFLKDTGILLGCYLTGFLLSGFLSVPAILYIFGNPRVGSSSSASLFWPLKVSIGYLLSFICAPFPLYSRFPNLFQINDNAYGYWYSQFVTIIPLIGAFHFIQKNKRWGILLAGLIAAVLIKPLSSAMHGFSDASMRWNFVIEFLLLALAGKGLDSDETPWLAEKAAHFYWLAALAAVLLLHVSGSVSLKIHWIHYLSLLVCLGFAAWTMEVFSDDYFKAGLLSILQVLMYACLMINTWYIEIPDGDWRLNENLMTYLQDTDEELIYRYQIDMNNVIPSGLNLNISLKYNFLSAKTYESTYDTNILPFLEFLKTDEIRLDINDPCALTMLGTKYWLAKDESELPRELSFRKENEISDLSVYRNLDYKGFGHTLKKISPLSELKETEQFLTTLFVEDEVYQELSSYDNGEEKTLLVTARSTNYLAGEIKLDKPSVLLVPVPNNQGWRIRDNGKMVSSIPVNGGFIGIPLSQGEHHIEMSFVSEGLKAGLMASAAGLMILLGIIILKKKQKG